MVLKLTPEMEVDPVFGINVYEFHLLERCIIRFKHAVRAKGVHSVNKLPM